MPRFVIESESVGRHFFMNDANDLVDGFTLSPFGQPDKDCSVVPEGYVACCRLLGILAEADRGLGRRCAVKQAQVLESPSDPSHRFFLEGGAEDEVRQAVAWPSALLGGCHCVFAWDAEVSVAVGFSDQRGKVRLHRGWC